MTDRPYRFSHAILRRPARSCVEGLRAVDTGAPDIAAFRRDHDAYRGALEASGVNVVVLDALEPFPDSVFVEDTALCLPEGAVAMRPGAPSRRGEVESMLPTLRTFFDDVRAIEGRACIEGGDVLVTGREILAGLSARTDTDGIEQLGRAVAGWGYRVRRIDVPDGILHFKTACSLLDEETILCTPAMRASGCFDGYRTLLTAPGEDACANAIRVNASVLLPSGFPATADALDAAGYEVLSIDNAQAAKLDGGMSCLSLRFARSAAR